MEGIQFITVTIFMTAQCLVILPTLAIGIRLTWHVPNASTRQRIVGMILFGAACLLLVWMFTTLASAPTFDFVDRCRPPGTGMCLDKRTFEAVRLEILRDYLLAALIYILLPIGLGVGSLLFVFQRIGRKFAVK